MDSFEENIISFTSFEDPPPDFALPSLEEEASLDIPVDSELGAWGNGFYCVVS
jgi:hypothetical protein